MLEGGFSKYSLSGFQSRTSDELDQASQHDHLKKKMLAVFFPVCCLKKLHGDGTIQIIQFAKVQKHVLENNFYSIRSRN